MLTVDNTCPLNDEVLEYFIANPGEHSTDDIFQGIRARNNQVHYAYLREALFSLLDQGQLTFTLNRKFQLNPRRRT